MKVARARMMAERRVEQCNFFLEIRCEEKIVLYFRLISLFLVCGDDELLFQGCEY